MLHSNPFMSRFQVHRLTLLVCSLCLPNKLTHHTFVQKLQEPISRWSVAHPTPFEWYFLTEFFDSLLNVGILLTSCPFSVPGLRNFVSFFLLIFFSHGERQKKPNDHDVLSPEFHPQSNVYLLWARSSLPASKGYRISTVWIEPQQRCK